jgi:hypothetical protein
VCVLRPHRIEIVSKWLMFVLCISLTSIFFWRLLLLPPQNDMVAIHYSGVPAHQSAVTSFALSTNGTKTAGPTQRNSTTVKRRMQ